MDIPKTMKVLKTDGKAGLVLITDAPVPDVPEDYLLVKVHHVALNPTDWKHLGDEPAGLTVGCDLSGTVVKVSPGAGTKFAVGDLVASYAHGQKPEAPTQGAFGEYALAKVGMTLRIAATGQQSPMTSAEACTLPLGSATVGQALFQRLHLPWPDQAGKTRRHSILVHGGGTATGQLAIQLAALSGWRVLATCSPRSAERCISAGAHETFDYRDPEACAKAIRESAGVLADGGLMYAFDCIGSPEAKKLCLDALTREKGRASLATIDPFYDPPVDEREVFSAPVFAYTAEGERFEFRKVWEASEQDYAFNIRFYGLLEGLVAAGKVRGCPLDRGDGFAEGSIMKGLGELKGGHVSGGKLVYKMG